MQADPDEIHNLAGSPDHAGVLTRMRDAHRAWEVEIKDLGFLSEWEMHERSKGATPYELGLDSSRYDFNAIFQAAEAASAIADNSLDSLISSLGDNDRAVRYWAAIGLLAREKPGVEAAHDALVAALSDPSPIVRIVAAEALGRFGSDSDAQATLKVLLKHAQPDENYYLTVAAWNALDSLDDRARPVLRELQDISTAGMNVPQRMDQYSTRLKNHTLSEIK